MKGKIMSLINGKSFDPSFICNRYRNDQSLVLVTIANEYEISREEFVERLLNCGEDELPRVRQMIKEDSRRTRREKKRKKRQAHEKAEKEQVKRKVRKVPTIQDSIDEMKAKIASAEANRDNAVEKSTAQRQLIAKSDQIIIATQNRIERLKHTIVEIETALEDYREDLGSNKNQLKEEEIKKFELIEAQEKADAEVAKAQEELDFLRLQLEELNGSIVYLISPTYDGELPTGPGRLISCTELSGVEVEEVDLDCLGFVEMVKISQELGINDISKLEQAYKFACLVVEYNSKAGVEVHVENNDEDIDKMIELLTD